ncbi:MAG: helix-turn-helix domain-containing protein [Tannerellaceae bacterium]|nr:helix-turn-helix domain-containing protein [Tannerellaceae bacterium]
MTKKQRKEGKIPLFFNSYTQRTPPLIIKNYSNDQNRKRLLSNLVADYDEEHYPIKTPTLAEVIKLRMHKMNLNQTKVSQLLEISPSRVSDYLTGKSEPTLKVAHLLFIKLKIDPKVVLGI